MFASTLSAGFSSSLGRLLSGGGWYVISRSLLSERPLFSASLSPVLLRAGLANVPVSMGSGDDDLSGGLTVLSAGFSNVTGLLSVELEGLETGLVGDLRGFEG